VSIPFSPRAALCTAAVMIGFVGLAGADLPAGIGGFEGFDREGMLPIARGGIVDPDQQRDILEVVLSHEARRPGRDNVCLELAAEGATFASEQREIEVLQRELSANPAARDEIAPRLDRLLNPVRPWMLPDAPPGGQPQPLSAESAQLLRTAETTFLTTRRDDRVDILLDMHAVPARFQSRAPGCRHLSFTAPAVASGLAFVETGYRSAQAPPEERLYAAALREGRWEIEAVASAPTR